MKLTSSSQPIRSLHPPSRHNQGDPRLNTYHATLFLRKSLAAGKNHVFEGFVLVSTCLDLKQLDYSKTISTCGYTIEDRGEATRDK